MGWALPQYIRNIPSPANPTRQKGGVQLGIGGPVDSQPVSRLSEEQRTTDSKVPTGQYPKCPCQPPAGGGTALKEHGPQGSTASGAGASLRSQDPARKSKMIAGVGNMQRTLLRLRTTGGPIALEPQRLKS